MHADPYTAAPYGLDSPLAYYPQAGSNLTPDMDFGARIKNMILYAVNSLVIRPMYIDLAVSAAPRRLWD